MEYALPLAPPTIWNRDQGSHCTSPQYPQRRAAAGGQIRMDGGGRALDNSFTERCWRALKYAEVYLHDEGAPRDARPGLTRYSSFNTHARPQQALAYPPPGAGYFGRPA